MKKIDLFNDILDLASIVTRGLMLVMLGLYILQSEEYLTKFQTIISVIGLIYLVFVLVKK